MGDMSGSSGNLGLGGLAAGTGGIGAAGSSGAGSTGGGGPCGACRFLRRKCVTGCIFAPYFHSERGAICFAAVHKVFGASNVSKLLARTPTHKRRDAVLTICYEAQFRIRNPVYGCVSQILSLQQQVMNLQNKVSYLQAHIATLELQAPSPPPPSPAPAVLLPPTPPTLSISDLPSAATLPATFNLEGIMDTPAWSLLQQDEQSQDQQDRHEQQLLELQQLVDGVGGGSFITENGSEDGDLQSPTDELIERMQE